LAFFRSILDWIKSLFWKEEMELTLVGLQYSGKTTFVNVIAVSVIMGELFIVILSSSSFDSYIFIWPFFYIVTFKNTPLHLSPRICT